MDQVFSAAKAIKFFEGKTKKEVWEIMTQMFELNDRKNYGVPSFVYGGNPFTEKLRGSTEPGQHQVGDLFKQMRGSPFYAEIVAWMPHDNYAMIEYFWENDETEPSTPDRTDFSFHAHIEGTVVEVVRREKGDPKVSFLERINGRKTPASWAAGRLAHIIGGAFPELRDLEKYSCEGYTISRDDSLRDQFFDRPSI